MFTVKIWYWSGAFESIPRVDEENALAYFAEAGHNARVRAAEIHEADGSLAQGFRHTRPVEQVDTAGQR